MRKFLIFLTLLVAIPDALAQSSGSAAVQSASITLSSVQLQHLAGSPVQLIAAPGTGQMICVLSSIAQYKAGSSAYTVQSGRLNLYMGNTGNAATVTAASGFLDQTTHQVRLMGGPSSADPQSSYENQPLMVTNDGSVEWTNGDGTVTITVYYTIVTLQ